MKLIPFFSLNVKLIYSGTSVGTFSSCSVWVDVTYCCYLYDDLPRDNE